jgi:hypothetical protein
MLNVTDFFDGFFSLYWFSFPFIFCNQALDLSVPAGFLRHVSCFVFSGQNMSEIVLAVNVEQSSLEKET